MRDRLLSRPALAALITVLAAGCAIMGVLVATGRFGNSTQYLPLTTCKIGTPGCVARGPADIHADFALFIDGQQFNFDQPQFAGKANADSAFDHGAKTVAVHKELTTWDSFFRSIGITLIDSTLPGGSEEATCLSMPGGQKYCTTKTDTFKFFVNGVKVDGISNSNIGDLDRVLVSYGPESVDDVKSQQLPKLTNQACQASDRCAAGS